MALTGVEQIAITSQPSGDRVLNELLTTLQQSPELNGGLVGHTDSAGAGAHDQELPDRRAASVYLWFGARWHRSGPLEIERTGLPRADHDKNDTGEGEALRPAGIEPKLLHGVETADPILPEQWRTWNLGYRPGGLPWSRCPMLGTSCRYVSLVRGNPACTGRATTPCLCWA